MPPLASVGKSLLTTLNKRIQVNHEEKSANLKNGFAMTVNHAEILDELVPQQISNFDERWNLNYSRGEFYFTKIQPHFIFYELLTSIDLVFKHFVKHLFSTPLQY